MIKHTHSHLVVKVVSMLLHVANRRTGKCEHTQASGGLQKLELLHIYLGAPNPYTPLSQQCRWCKFV